ncbi:Gfo/Idh/MocA family oxidoreductase [Deinococcus detaillensis]|uniref:Gfo/Idh/MocA family oxidoreductase n=1 Tax=Deinococcus detaillensis TaxID=2592048 RepID=A0A553V3Y6_9DEIO|nr:Gfo/Idh/MocA family oxidoreductase [Deinococcus detaillensis]TSA87167.1 Gfo/Idh/MocA family oxidoreductase [Deinococcus detaillensis]
MTHFTQAPGLRWGLFGAARIARALIPAIRESGGTVEIVGVRDPASEHARDFAAEWNIPRIGTYQEVVEAELDAVYNPLPNDLHWPWSAAAMRAGKHVLTEKPLSLNAKEAQQLAQVALETGRVSLEAFAYRFQPHVTRIREIVRSGELGELRSLQGSYGFFMTNPSDFRWLPDMGGGALYDVGCYPVNFMRLLLGEPGSVAAQARWTDQGVDLGISGVMDYPDLNGGGALASINCAFDWQGTPRLALYGTAGSLEMEQPFESSNRQPLILRVTVGEQTREETFAPSNGYTLMVSHFQRAARGEEALLYPPEDAVKQARVLDALFASARRGQRVTLDAEL